MPVVFDNVILNGDVDTGSSATLTQSFTVAAGGSIFCWGRHDSANVTGISWNTSEALTSIQASVDDSGGGAQRVALFGILAPTSGTHNLVITFSSTTGGQSRGITILSYTGVSNYRTPAHGATPLAIGSVSGDIVICVGNGLAVGAMASGQTQRGSSFNMPGGTSNWATAGETTAAGASTSMSFSGGIGFDTLIGVALIAAAAGGSDQLDWQRRGDLQNILRNYDYQIINV